MATQMNQAGKTTETARERVMEGAAMTSKISGWIGKAVQVGLAGVVLAGGVAVLGPQVAQAEGNPACRFDYNKNLVLDIGDIFTAASRYGELNLSDILDAAEAVAGSYGTGCPAA